MPTGTINTGLHVNVKAHGAKGDGTTDDTAAINSAITAAWTNDGTVFFPAGNYKVTSTIDLTGKYQMHFQGGNETGGGHAQFLKPPSVRISGETISTGAVFKADGAVQTSGSYTFENLTVNGGLQAFNFANLAEVRFSNVGASAVNYGGATNCAIYCNGTFWFWYEKCALQAPAVDKYAVITTGYGAGLHCFTETTFAAGGVNSLTAVNSVPGALTFDNATTEGFNSALLTITETGLSADYHMPSVVMKGVTHADAGGATNHPLIYLNSSHCLLDSPVIIAGTGGRTASGLQAAIIVAAGQVNSATFIGCNRESRFIYNTSDVIIGNFKADKEWGFDLVASEASGPTDMLLTSVIGPAIRLSPGGQDYAQVGISSHSSQGITFGAGTGTTDTNLYRSAANRVKTDDNLHAVDGVTTKYKAGTPVDGDFATTPPDGTIVVDSSANKIWTRIGGVWKGVVVA